MRDAKVHYLHDDATRKYIPCVPNENAYMHKWSVEPSDVTCRRCKLWMGKRLDQGLFL